MSEASNGNMAGAGGRGNKAGGSNKKPKHTKQSAKVISKKLKEKSEKRQIEISLLQTKDNTDEEKQKLAKLLDEVKRLNGISNYVGSLVERDDMDIDEAIESSKTKLADMELDAMDWEGEPESEAPPPPPPPPPGGSQPQPPQGTATDRQWTADELNSLPDYEFKQDVNMWAFDGRVEAKVAAGYGHRLIIASGPRRFCIYRMVASSTWSGGGNDQTPKAQPRKEPPPGATIHIKGVAYADKDNNGPEMMNPDNYGKGKKRFPPTYVKVLWADLESPNPDECTTWETRTTVRKRLGSKAADNRIYGAAMALEKSAKEWIDTHPGWEKIIDPGWEMNPKNAQLLEQERVKREEEEGEKEIKKEDW